MHNDSVAPLHYDVLQVSPTADAEIIQASYRALVRRYHPDNQQTGDAEQFRLISDAHHVLSDPVRRAKYDAMAAEPRQDRWRLAASGIGADNEFEIEQACRLTLLELLYMRRRIEPGRPSVLPSEVVQLTGRSREALEFTIWFLVSKGLVQRSDNSGLAITVAGVEYLEENHRALRRLPDAALART